MQEEYNAFVKNNTWDIVSVPDNQKVLKSKWVYKLKMSNKGTISRYKARWVAIKFKQQENIDYAKTFSLVAKSCNIRILFVLAAYYSWYIKHLNAVIAYINSDIDVLLYVKLLDRYKESEKAELLRKNIYGLKQSACQWHKNLSAKLFKTSLTQLMSNYSVFIQNAGSSKMVIIVIYVDNFLVFELDKSKINNINW